MPLFFELAYFVMEKREDSCVCLRVFLARLFAYLIHSIKFKPLRKSGVFLRLKGGIRLLDKEYMKLALQLAKSVKGQTTPNPPVGAVVVKDGAIIGFGAHLKSGEEHAEVIALQMAGEKAHDATIFVTLEPCSHDGKTAPCADLIIKKGIKRVVIACTDYHEKVAGSGIMKLTKAGIDVEVGLLHKEALQLYDVFFHYIKNKLPYVTVKSAVSLDGKIATAKGDSKWITNKTARTDVHHYRHCHDAILVGINTVLNDNPRLTTRIQNGKNPVRIILDTHLRTPLHANVVTDKQAETWIFVGEKVSAERKEPFKNNQFVRIFTVESEKIDIKNVLRIVALEGITSVFVEGGATVNDAFLQKNLMNQFIMYIAPIIIGGKNAKTSFAGEGFQKLTEALEFQIKQVEKMDDNLKIVAVRKG